MEETERLVQGEINKVLPAFCILLLRCIKANNVTEKESVREFARNFQENWIKEIDGQKQAECNKIRSYPQKDIIKTQENVQVEQETNLNHIQNIISKEESDDWYENLLKKPKSRNNSILTNLKLGKDIPFESKHPNLTNNIQFIKNILTVNDEIERSSKFPTVLHEVLFDKVNHTLQLHSKVTGTSIKDGSSEDSGFYSEEVSEEGFITTEPVPDANVKKKETSLTAVDSLLSIINHIKTDIDSKTDEVYYNWKNSIVEHSISIVAKCSLKGNEFEEIIKYFIVDMLQEIWSSVQMDQHIKWSQKISILKELFTTPTICLEILYFIAGVLENVTTAMKKGVCSSLMLVKVALFLDLIPFMTRELNGPLKTSKRQSRHRSINVTTLWQEKFSSVTSESEPPDENQLIKTDIIPKLVIFLTSATNKEPLISLKAKEALEILENLFSEPKLSQDSLIDMY